MLFTTFTPVIERLTFVHYLAIFVHYLAIQPGTGSPFKARRAVTAVSRGQGHYKYLQVQVFTIKSPVLMYQIMLNKDF